MTAVTTTTSSSTVEQREDEARAVIETSAPGQLAPGHRVAGPGLQAAHAGRPAVGRYGRRHGVPEDPAGHRAVPVRPATAAAGTLTSRIGMPTLTIDQRGRRRTTRTNTTIVGTNSSSCASAYPVQPPRAAAPRSGARPWLHPRRSRPVRTVVPSDHPGSGPGAPDRGAARRKARSISDPGSRDPNRGDRHDEPHQCPPAACRTLERHPPVARDPRLARVRGRSPSAWPSRSPPRRPPTPTTGSVSPAARTRWSRRPASTTRTPRAC